VRAFLAMALLAAAVSGCGSGGETSGDLLGVP
jgi:hypothetical protein